jgi:uncharacterized membrane protein HdeD (DUF308 family)
MWNYSLVNSFNIHTTGASSKNGSKGSRTLMIGVGVLAADISFMVFATPLLGIAILNFVLAIALLIIGIQCIASAISNGRHSRSASIER